ncbi:MAG: biotin--[acetyl-CoA-carboxylase] ligase [Candidatus Omnitrophica bacterium]|nr:biotin--[acetyl-CoA-carboxylase] ligase [Candidatus Omnitrophota bacterium]
MKEFEAKREIIAFFRNKRDKFISGEDISDSLGFSRASVWKYIKKLREDGYSIEAVPNLGYKLAATPAKMYGYDIASVLKTRKFGKKNIYHYESIDSTNNKAYELAESGEPEGTVVIAENQTQGKGRMGRRWVSPKGTGIYMSLIVRPDAEMDEIPAMTLITAYCIIKAVKDASGLEARMKWPNDVIVNGKKLCGILTEIKAQPDQVNFLVLGIGVNVNTPSSKLPPEGTSIKNECGCEIDRPDLARGILTQFEKGYTRFTNEGFGAIRKECMDCSFTLGKKVKVLEHHRSIEGEAVDIDEKGALIIRTASGEKRRVFSGDVDVLR